jgi:hypothetical protein
MPRSKRPQRRVPLNVEPLEGRLPLDGSGSGPDCGPIYFDPPDPPPPAHPGPDGFVPDPAIDASPDEGWYLQQPQHAY